MRLSSVGITACFAPYRGFQFLAILLFGLVPATPARASHGWIDFTSDGRWRSTRQQ
jgi:hypothetical protein